MEDGFRSPLISPLLSSDFILDPFAETSIIKVLEARRQIFRATELSPAGVSLQLSLLNFSYILSDKTLVGVQCIWRISHRLLLALWLITWYLLMSAHVRFLCHSNVLFLNRMAKAYLRFWIIDLTLVLGYYFLQYCVGGHRAMFDKKFYWIGD